MCVECLVENVSCKCGSKEPNELKCECEAGVKCLRCGHSPITPAPPATTEPPMPSPGPVPPTEEASSGPTSDSGGGGGEGGTSEA
jgi:hypothetical protein